MDNIDSDKDEIDEEIMPLRQIDSRRQRQQLRFSQEEEEEEEKKPEKTSSSFKPPGRASRFLSICEPSLQLSGSNLLRLRQLHSQLSNTEDSLISGEITDELLDKIPFKIEIIPERQDDFNIEENPLQKRGKKTKETMEIPAVIPSGLSEKRRLQIINEILKDLSQKNILDETRRANAIPFQLPKNNQMQKNVANRIRDLTGSDIIMLNDHIYMKNLCNQLNEKHQKELEANFERLASNGKRR